MRRRTAAVGVGAGLLLAVLLAVVLVLTSRGPTIISYGPRDRPWVALTFDADMTPSMLARLRDGRVDRWFDPAILTELRAWQTSATIFVTGLWAQAYPGLTRSLASDPLFELENHSMDHAAFREPCFGLPALRTEEQRRREIVQAAATITEITGLAPRYFRFPGGCYEASDLRLVRRLGHEPVQWDTISGDSFQQDPEAVVRNVLDHVRPGSIVVMHLNGAPNAPATAKAVAQLIPKLHERGLTLVHLRQLLAGRALDL